MLAGTLPVGQSWVTPIHVFGFGFNVLLRYVA